MYFVYMIKNDFKKLYVGITENPKARLYYHNSKMGAEFTKGKAKFQIVFLEEQESLAEARKREIQIKKWRRDKKEKLIDLYSRGINTKLWTNWQHHVLWYCACESVAPQNLKTESGGNSWKKAK